MRARKTAARPRAGGKKGPPRARNIARPGGRIVLVDGKPLADPEAYEMPAAPTRQVLARDSAGNRPVIAPAPQPERDADR